jgi:hypothetical protein
VTPSPQDFHDRAVAAADAEGRLPLPDHRRVAVDALADLGASRL